MLQRNNWKNMDKLRALIESASLIHWRDHQTGSTIITKSVQHCLWLSSVNLQRKQRSLYMLVSFSKKFKPDPHYIHRMMTCRQLYRSHFNYFQSVSMLQTLLTVFCILIFCNRNRGTLPSIWLNYSTVPYIPRVTLSSRKHMIYIITYLCKHLTPVAYFIVSFNNRLA